LLQTANLEIFYRVNVALDVEENPSKYPYRAIANVNFHHVAALTSISSTSIREAFKQSSTSFSWKSLSLPYVPSNGKPDSVLAELHPDVLKYILDKDLYGYRRMQLSSSRLSTSILIAGLGVLIACHIFLRSK
jgi:hypothetical protein